MIGRYAKSIVGALAAGSGSLYAAMADGVVVPGEWVTVGITVLGALGIVAIVPNAAKSDIPKAGTQHWRD
jgi:hypothetical protein